MASFSQPAIAPSSQLSLVEVAKRLDPKGNVADIAEALNESNEIIQDVVFKEGNLPTGDEQTIRTGLPTVYWRQLNRGVPASHSTVAQVTETCAEMSARSQVDVSVMELNGNTAQFRSSEEKPFIEAMGQQFAHTLFYGDARKKPEGFTGFAPRYSTLSESKAKCAKNVINCGATAQSTNVGSIWIIGWGDNVYCPYPKGSKVGLQSKDMGSMLVDDDLGNKYEAYVNMYYWKVGLMVRDWRYVVRLANIDIDALYNGTGIGSGDIKTSGTTNILLKIQEALTKIPRGGRPKLKMYMNSDVFNGLNTVCARTDLDVIKFADATDQFGSPETWASFKGIPLRQVDQLSSNEDIVA